MQITHSLSSNSVRVTELRITKLGNHFTLDLHVPANLVLVDVIDRAIFAHAEVEPIKLTVIQQAHLFAELDWMLRRVSAATSNRVRTFTTEMVVRSRHNMGSSRDALSSSGCGVRPSGIGVLPVSVLLALVAAVL